MKNISLVYRSVRVLSILIFVICVVISCARRESNYANPESDNISADKCHACIIDSFFVKQVSGFVGEKVFIDEPVAIQFFNRVRLADRFDNKKSYDTLMKLFKMKHQGDRNVIYSLRDQYFYFEAEIKPVLEKRSIKIIDSIPNNQFLEFRGSNVSTVVNSSDYNDQDGVLFFIPEKRPLFWTLDRERVYCRENQGLTTQYFLCP